MHCIYFCLLKTNIFFVPVFFWILWRMQHFMKHSFMPWMVYVDYGPLWQYFFSSLHWMTPSLPPVPQNCFIVIDCCSIFPPQTSQWPHPIGHFYQSPLSICHVTRNLFPLQKKQFDFSLKKTFFSQIL